MNIIAKLKCESVKDQNYGQDGSKSSEEVALRAVYSEDKTSENYSFSCATPCAFFQMTISNPSAWGAFVEGSEYLVTFEPSTK